MEGRPKTIIEELMEERAPLLERRERVKTANPAAFLAPAVADVPETLAAASPRPDEPSKPVAVEPAAEQKEIYKPIVEQLSPEEAEEIFAKAEIHGSPLNKKDLTPEILRNNNLLPNNKITIYGNVLYSSSSYDMGDSRLGVVAYVERNGKIVARSYYLSNSQGVWRYLPNYRSRDGAVDWYGKGYDEASITLPAETGMALAEITKIGSPVLQVTDPELVFAGTAREIKPNRGNDTYYVQVEAKPIEFGNFHARSGKIEPEKIKLPAEQLGHAPDLAPGKTLAQWVQNSKQYGEIRNEVLLSLDGKFKFTFCRDKLDRVWIGNIEDDSTVESTGLKNRWVDAGDLTTPAEEYGSQAGKYGNHELRSGRYVDMFKNYLSQIQIIRDYCESRSIPLPPLLGAKVEKSKSEEVVRLEKIIRAARRRLAEIDIELKIDSLEEERNGLIKKKRDSYFNKNGIQKDIDSVDMKIDELENPFKWFIIGKNNLSAKNFRIMFGDNATLEKINEVTGETDEDFKKVAIWETSLEILKTEKADIFSSNGFYIKLANNEQVRDKKGEIENENARYNLVNPHNEIILRNLDPKSAKKSLRAKADDYQVEQLALFESENLEEE